jgi:hypothetical protein
VLPKINGVASIVAPSTSRRSSRSCYQGSHARRPEARGSYPGYQKAVSVELNDDGLVCGANDLVFRMAFAGWTYKGHKQDMEESVMIWATPLPYSPYN